MEFMGNDGHAPALPILCGFASVSHTVACARCERTNPNACRKTKFFDSLPPALPVVFLTQQKSVKPDFIEVLPGAMPEVLRRLCDEVRIPVIAGGLLTDRTSVMSALDAGAIAVSSTNHKVWEL